MLPDLKQARLENGISLEQLSAMFKLSTKTLSKYEANPGKAPVDVTVRLFALYNIPLTNISRKKKPC